MSDLCVNRFKLIQYLPQLTLTDLEDHLLLLVISTLRFILFQVHLHVESRLLQSFSFLRRYFHIHSPVEVSQLWQAGELVLVVSLGSLGNFTHHLEDKDFDFLWE